MKHESKIEQKIPKYNGYKMSNSTEKSDRQSRKSVDRAAIKYNVRYFTIFFVFVQRFIDSYDI